MKTTLYSALLGLASLGLLAAAPTQCHAQKGHQAAPHYSSPGHSYGSHYYGSPGRYYGSHRYYGGRYYGSYPYRAYSYYHYRPYRYYYPWYGSYYPYPYYSYYYYPYYYYPYAYYPSYDYDYDYPAPNDYYYSTPPDTEAYGSYEAPSAVTVGVYDNYFEPRTTEITAGTTVRWTNSGAQPHTITSYRGLFDSGDLAAGNSFSFTFNEPGTYYYYCRVHPDEMWGTIVVR
jgi:plastocyanin